LQLLELTQRDGHGAIQSQSSGCEH
jgi:hypothetical protein